MIGIASFQKIINWYDHLRKLCVGHGRVSMCTCQMVSSLSTFYGVGRYLWMHVGIGLLQLGYEPGGTANSAHDKTVTVALPQLLSTYLYTTGVVIPENK